MKLIERLKNPLKYIFFPNRFFNLFLVKTHCKIIPKELRKEIP